MKNYAKITLIGDPTTEYQYQVNSNLGNSSSAREQVQSFSANGFTLLKVTKAGETDPIYISTSAIATVQDVYTK